jgi:hypothetical protein
VLRTLPWCTCRRHYPGAAAGCLICSLPQPYQPSRKGLSGRPAHRLFRGLLSVHSRCSLHTRAATLNCGSHSEGFNRFVASTVAPVASGWSIFAGRAFHPLGSAAFSQRPPFWDIRNSRDLSFKAAEADVRDFTEFGRLPGLLTWLYLFAHTAFGTIRSRLKEVSPVRDPSYLSTCYAIRHGPHF